MSKIKIVTDSTMDMSEEALLKYKNELEVVPLSVMINGQTFLDRVEINPVDFIKMMRESANYRKLRSLLQVHFLKYTIV